MEKIFKISAMFMVLLSAVVASLFILEIISLDISKDVIFKSVFLILTFIIAAMLILLIGGEPKKIGK